MFRELNRIRNEYHACDRERRELRVQLVMLQGELDLAQCQLAEMLSNQQRKQCESISSNVSFVGSSNDRLSSSSTSIKNEKFKFVNHFSVYAFSISLFCITFKMF